VSATLKNKSYRSFSCMYEKLSDCKEYTCLVST